MTENKVGIGHMSSRIIKSNTEVTKVINKAEKDRKNTLQDQEEKKQYFKVVIEGKFEEIDDVLIQQIQRKSRDFNLKVVEVRESSIEILFNI